VNDRHFLLWEICVSNIFFVGLMGAGKTTVGRVLAKNLDKKFYDTDCEIERRTGVRIPVIFELESEAGFRKREVAMIEELSQMQNIVLATGGGAVLAQENRDNLKKNGIVIYLRANVHELWLRTRNDKNRPLLQRCDARAKLEQLFKERDPLYCEIATYIVDTGGQPVNTIVHHIEELLKTNE
jgi:shikimate kinase